MTKIDWEKMSEETKGAMLRMIDLAAKQFGAESPVKYDPKPQWMAIPGEPVWCGLCAAKLQYGQLEECEFCWKNVCKTCRAENLDFRVCVDCLPEGKKGQYDEQ